MDSPSIEGITISGGEPFQQPEGLLQLLRGVRAATNLSVIVYSGYRLAEIEQMPLGNAIAQEVDVLIDGRYVHTLRIARAMRGSGNQNLHLLTNRYTFAELEAIVRCEIRIEPHGKVVVSGIRPVGDLDAPTAHPLIVPPGAPPGWPTRGGPRARGARLCDN